jgi:hypothetical protein
MRPFPNKIGRLNQNLAAAVSAIAPTFGAQLVIIGLHFGHQSIVEVYPVLGATLVHDTPSVQNESPIAKHPHCIQIVRDKNNPTPLSAEFPDSFHALLLKVPIAN